jgi:COP9 signalosome complex subunit 3
MMNDVHVSGIPILYRAIELLRREPGQLLSIHSDLYQLSLLCQWFEPALTYLNTDIVDINRENGKFDVKYLLLAYYYGGMIYACLKQFDRAANFFENVITVPATATSAIALEAYKKYVLVKLISGTIPNHQLPTYTSRHVQQTIKSLCGAQYTELFHLFHNGTLSQYDEFINRHREQYVHDRNLGLIKQTRHAFICNSIQQLTKTFLTVSLKDLANRVQLQSIDEAERYLLNMIEHGQIFASINKKDGRHRTYVYIYNRVVSLSIRHGYISWFAGKVRCYGHASEITG